MDGLIRFGGTGNNRNNVVGHGHYGHSGCRDYDTEQFILSSRWRRSRRRPVAYSPRRLARHRVFDYADNGREDGPSYTAAHCLAEQLPHINTARGALKNWQ